MNSYLFYDLATGNIEGTYRSTQPIPEPPAGMGVLEETTDMQANYVSGGVITPREELASAPAGNSFNYAVGDTFVIDGIPDGTRFQVTPDHEEVVVDDGKLELTLATPGVYYVRLIDCRYLFNEWELRCL